MSKTIRRAFSWKGARTSRCTQESGTCQSIRKWPQKISRAQDCPGWSFGFLKTHRLRSARLSIDRGNQRHLHHDNRGIRPPDSVAPAGGRAPPPQLGLRHASFGRCSFRPCAHNPSKESQSGPPALLAPFAHPTRRPFQSISRSRQTRPFGQAFPRAPGVTAKGAMEQAGFAWIQPNPVFISTGAIARSDQSLIWTTSQICFIASAGLVPMGS